MQTSERSEYELFVSCLGGLEPLLADELKALGLRRIRPLRGGVACFAVARRAMAACLWSRLASRVSLVVGRVEARNAEVLYEGVRALAWEDVLAPRASMAVSAHGMNDELRNTRFTALKVKDAVCDRLRDTRGERPDVEPYKPDARIDVRVREGKATVSLDLTGESLYRRTYLEPDAGQEAPLACALAAATLAAAGWQAMAAEGAACLDAACGDGTLVVEAALVACDVAPSLDRERWGFVGWAAFSADAWEELLADARDRAQRGKARAAAPGAFDGSGNVLPDERFVRFAGLSLSSPSITRARRRVRRAGLRPAASIEFGGAECAGEVVGRVSAAARKLASGKKPPCLAASVLAAREQASDANAQAQAAAVCAAAAAAPAGSVCAVAGGETVRARYGTDPAQRVRFGHDRVAVDVLLFDQPPAKPAVVMVPDSAGGAEHRVEVLDENSAQFAARLRKNAKERRKWARREGVTCYRVYDADLPDYAVAIDVYEGAGQAEGNTYLHIAEYAPPASVDPEKALRRFADVLALAPVVLGIRADHVFSKTRQRDKGGSQYRDAGRRPYVTHVQEAGHLLEVDLAGYLDTGLFLDHRTTRQMVGGMAEGKRFLNLFAYTGSATVHAAAAGAVETVTVDLSQTYLDWARRNMELNGFAGEQHMFERGDVMQWITECRRQPRRFDVAFVDPPTFSNSKAMGRRTWDVQRDHVELLIGVSRLLTESGVAVFSCNLRSFKPDVEQLAKYGVALEDITTQTIPHDFERNPKIHKCYLVRRN